MFAAKSLLHLIRREEATINEPAISPKENTWSRGFASPLPLAPNHCEGDLDPSTSSTNIGSQTAALTEGRRFMSRSTSQVMKVRHADNAIKGIMTKMSSNVCSP